MSDGLFGNFFDLNKNGNINMFERVVELGILETIMEDEEDLQDSDLEIDNEK